ncbi:MAG: hypothetical protein HC924_16210, partial [Synechococcaceae cyanobacterium SM2_3_2]|nr:hypothetical protein [Synechococcaceae cyanobacterium SM2_3_2]
MGRNQQPPNQRQESVKKSAKKLGKKSANTSQPHPGSPVDPQQEKALVSADSPETPHSSSEPQAIAPKAPPKRAFDPRSVFSKVGLPMSISQELGVTQAAAGKQPDGSLPQENLPQKSLPQKSLPQKSLMDSKREAA